MKFIWSQSDATENVGNSFNLLATLLTCLTLATDGFHLILEVLWLLSTGFAVKRQ